MPFYFDYEEIAGKFYPVIPIELKAKEKRFFSRAYVDSGASFSIFNAEIADYLGLDYRKGDKIYSIDLEYALMIWRKSFTCSRKTIRSESMK